MPIRVGDRDPGVAGWKFSAVRDEMLFRRRRRFLQDVPPQSHPFGVIQILGGVEPIVLMRRRSNGWKLCERGYGYECRTGIRVAQS